MVGHLGPDLLDPAVDLAEAVRHFTAQPDRAIGEALLDQRLAAGIGNVYKSELLYLHRLHPTAPIAAVADLDALLRDAVRLLSGNLGHFNRTTTGWRQAGRQYWVYGRTGKACYRCRGEILSMEQGPPGSDRITYYCARCQTTPLVPPG